MIEEHRIDNSIDKTSYIFSIHMTMETHNGSNCYIYLFSFYSSGGGGGGGAGAEGGGGGGAGSSDGGGGGGGGTASYK